MKSTQRTLVFVVVALVSAGIAYTSNQFTKPASIEGYGDFDKEFFPDFTDPSKATAIRVVSFDESLAAAKEFLVANKDGWRIVSHNNYPADGKEQLAKAASSMIALRRGALATRRETDHERFGVIEPDDESNAAIKGRGTRITLLGKGEAKLADLVVGNKVEGNEEKRYVRKVGEKNVYMVAARFDVTTKFAEWAESDLLKVSGWDILRLKGTRPKEDENEEPEVVELSREKSGDPWKLPGIDEATEELKTDDINTMVNTLDDLRLVGVRAKPSFGGKSILNNDLKIELPPELRNPQVIQQVREVLSASLGEKGFRTGRDEDGNSMIVAQAGELAAGTKDGVLYKLSFGSVFSGTDAEIEIGAKSSDAKDADSKKSDADKKAPSKPGDQKQSRYVFVRAEFDEKLLGERPTAPVKPTAPPGVEEVVDSKPEDKSATGEKPTTNGDKKSSEKSDADKPEKNESAPKKSDEASSAAGDDKIAASQDEKKPDEKKTETEDKPKADTKPAAAKDKDDAKKSEPADEKKVTADKPKADSPSDEKKDAEKKDSEKKPEEKSKDELKAEYLDAIKKYDIEKGKFNTESAAYDAKIETGKTKVKELNDRFADWYYVISNDSFEKLRLSRADLVKAKAAPATESTDKKDEPKSESTDDKPKTNAAEKPTDSEKPADAEKPAAKDSKSSDK